MTLADPDRADLELALAAAEAGAAAVRARFGGPLTRFAKSPGDFATVADLESEKAIVEILRTARPADAVLGEEGGRTGPAAASRTWMVDPLCGTLNFAAETPLVSVNVALRGGAGVEVGVAADPFARELFWAAGGRAGLRRAGADEALAPSPQSRLVDVDLDSSLPDRPGYEVVQLLTDAEFTRQFGPRVLSTSLALVWVAAGRRAAYVTDADVSDSVHFASGIAICRAAGCIVTGPFGQPLDASVRGLVVSADQSTHETLMAIIRRLHGAAGGTELSPSQP